MSLLLARASGSQLMMPHGDSGAAAALGWPAGWLTLSIMLVAVALAPRSLLRNHHQQQQWLKDHGQA